MDGALFAAEALRQLGHPPLLLDLRAFNDDDHVIAIFKEKNLWGALAKSNTTMLRYRDPIYKTIRELALSYFFAYFNTKGDMSLRAYSRPFNLTKHNYSDWQYSSENIDFIGDDLDKTRHYLLLPLAVAMSLPKAPKQLMQACFTGADQKGLFKPKTSKKE